MQPEPMHRRHIRFACGLVCALAVAVAAQGLNAQEANTRAAQIDAARASRLSSPPKPTPKRFQLVDTWVNRVNSVANTLRIRTEEGVRVKIGGLVSGSGFGGGLEYSRRDLPGGAMFRTGGLVTWKQYQKYDLLYGFPSIADGRLFAFASSVHRNFPGLAYFGPGPASHRGNRTDYRLEDTSFTGIAGVKVAQLRLGGSAGLVFVNIGPGSDSRYTNTDQVFSARQTPGIDSQPDFLRTSAVAQFDYRNNAKAPVRGGNYFAEYSSYRDRKLGRHDFESLEVDVQQFVPFFNQERVIALRGHTVLTFPHAGQTVPFYLQPTLGGARDMRGFKPFRFYDNNSILFSGEYLWQTFRGTLVALFFDAGKVFPNLTEFKLRGLQQTAGVGLRVHTPNVVARFDVGVGREGVRIWFRFDNPFASGPATLDVAD